MTDGFAYFDAEPEDAWHPDDPTRELLDNLCRRCAILGEPRPTIWGRDATDTARLDELGERLHRLIRRRDQLGDRERVRVDLIAQDVAFLRQRLGVG